MKKISTISKAAAAVIVGSTLFIGCGSSSSSSSSTSDTTDFTITDGLVVNEGNGNIKVGTNNLVHQGNGIWRITHTSALDGNLSVPASAIVDNGDGIYNASEDTNTTGFTMLAPMGQGFTTVTPLSDEFARNADNFAGLTTAMLAKIKSFNTMTAAFDAATNDDNVTAGLLTIANSVKNNARTFENQPNANRNDVNLTAALVSAQAGNTVNPSDINISGAGLDAAVEAALQASIVADVNKTNNFISFVNALQDSNSSLTAAAISALSAQVLDHGVSVTDALQNVEDMNISGVDMNTTSILTNADVNGSIATADTSIATANTANDALVTATPILIKLADSKVTFGSETITLNANNTFEVTHTKLGASEDLTSFYNVGFKIETGTFNKDTSFLSDLVLRIDYNATTNATVKINDANVTIGDDSTLGITLPQGTQVDGNVTGLNVASVSATTSSDLTLTETDGTVNFNLNTLLGAFGSSSAVENYVESFNAYARQSAEYNVSIGFSIENNTTAIDTAFADLNISGETYKGFTGAITIVDSPLEIASASNSSVAITETSVALGGTFTVTATVKNSAGTALEGKVVTFTDGSGVVTATTNDSGVATKTCTMSSNTANAGTNTITVSVGGIEIGTDTITRANIAPTFTGSISNIDSAAIGAAITNVDYSSVFTDTDGDTLTFTASGLPAGLTLDTNGTLYGTPTTEDNATVTITASDAVGSEDSDEFNISVVTDPLAAISSYTLLNDGDHGVTIMGSGTNPGLLYVSSATDAISGGLPTNCIGFNKGTSTATLIAAANHATYDVCVYPNRIYENESATFAVKWNDDTLSTHTLSSGDL